MAEERQREKTVEKGLIFLVDGREGFVSGYRGIPYRKNGVSPDRQIFTQV
jgi:hypothetical protein